MGWIEISHCPGGLPRACSWEETPPEKGELESPRVLMRGFEISSKVPPLGLELRVFAMVSRKREVASRNSRGKAGAIGRHLQHGSNEYYHGHERATNHTALL